MFLPSLSKTAGPFLSNKPIAFTNFSSGCLPSILNNNTALAPTESGFSLTVAIFPSEGICEISKVKACSMAYGVSEVSLGPW
jgi:hypothetical protein